MSKNEKIMHYGDKVIQRFSTWGKGGKAYKMQLYTKLSTLSTFCEVEKCDLHNKGTKQMFCG